MNIPINEIWADHTFNTCREPFAPETCSSLAASIGKYGQIEPVIVTPIEHDQYKYKLVIGYRRFIAVAVLLQHEEIYGAISSIPPEKLEELSMINYVENLERSNLSYYEEALGLRNNFASGTIDNAIAQAVSRSRSWVRLRWKLWDLPEEIIEQVKEGFLTASDIGIIIQQSPEEQIAKAERIRLGKERGESTRSMGEELTSRSGVRPKKEIKRVMTQLLAEDKLEAIHALRYSIQEINESQLFTYLGCDTIKSGRALPDRDR